MARIVPRFPESQGRKYPWDKWQNPTHAWEAVQGEDFDDAHMFVHVLHNRARYKGLKVKTKTGRKRGREVVWFQFDIGEVEEES